MKASDYFRRTSLASLALTALVAGWTCSAQAQSSVEIYGLVDMNVGTYRDSGGGRSSQVASGKMTTSYLGYRGQEDLGGGMSAFFALESHLRTDTGEPGRNATDPFFSRNAYVGLTSNQYGSVILGRYNTPLWLASITTNPFGSSTGFSPFVRLIYGTTGKVAGDAVWNNSVVYRSPRIGSVTGLVQYQFKETSQGSNIGGNLIYSNSGPLVLAAAAQRVETAFTKGKETTAMVGGSYNFGIARAFAQYASVKEENTATATTNTRDKIYQVGTAVPVGLAGAVLVSYARADTDGAARGERRFVSLGYDYRLSKRTDIYAVAMSDKYNSLGRGNSVGFGVRHTF